MVIQNSVTLCGSIGDEKLDEDELKDQIEHLEIANYNLIIQLNDRKIEDLEEKIQKLYQIETQTNSLYSDAEALYSSVESGITAIKKSWDGLQDTITDTGVDLLAGATSSAVGAAVGSLFLPPLGTAVGAVAGIAVDELLNFDFIDINNDGEKDSIVDGTKMLFDSACDAVGDFIDSIF